MNLLNLSWKNLTFKPLSMLLSLILFALGVGLISLLLLLNTQIEDKFAKNLADIDLVIGAKGSPLQMILNSMYHVDAPTGNIPIKGVKPFMNPKHPLIRLAIPVSMGDNYKSYRIVGTNHNFVDSLYFGKIKEGALWKADFEVSVGAAVAAETGLKLGDRFYSAHGLVDDGINVHDHGDGFKVVGIFEPSGTVLDQLILTNTQSIWKVHEDHDHEEEDGGEEAHDHDHEGHDHEGHDHEGHDHEGHDHEGHDHEGHDHDHSAHAEEASQDITEAVDQEITSLLVRYRNKSNWRSLNMPRNINENTDMLAASPAYEMNRLMSMMGAGEQLLQGIALIIVIVSGLSIFISLFNSLRDRRYELALMRVMGASRGRLFMLIVLEGLILAVLGYIIGILLSHLSMSLFSSYMKDAYRYTFSGWTFLPAEVWLLLGALVIGFIAAILPAISASRTDISTTLTES